MPEGKPEENSGLILGYRREKLTVLLEPELNFDFSYPLFNNFHSIYPFLQKFFTWNVIISVLS